MIEKRELYEAIGHAKAYISALVAAQGENATDTLFNILIAKCEIEGQEDYCQVL